MAKKLVLIAVLLTLAAAPAWATAINPLNTRPWGPVPGPAAGEADLQAILNFVYSCPGCVDKNLNQQAAGMWGIVSPGGIFPVLRFEYAGDAATNKFGVWAGTDSTAITSYELFPGSAQGDSSVPPDGFPNTSAFISWDISPVSGHLGLSGSPGILFTGIPFSGFGFYIDATGPAGAPGGRYYTVDMLNPGGTAQALAYIGPGNTWVLAFEDKLLGGGADGDHNDLVVSVESLIPVPEPGSMILLGTGLLGLAGAVRRRFRK